MSFHNRPPEINAPEQLLQYFTDKKYRLNLKDFSVRFKKYANGKDCHGKPFVRWNQALNSENIPFRFIKNIDAVINQLYQDYLNVCDAFDNQQIEISVLRFPGREKQIIRSLNPPTFECNFTFHDNSCSTMEIKPKLHITYKLNDFFHFWAGNKNETEEIIFSQYNTDLTLQIAGTQTKNVMELLNLGVNPNKYSINYGNNPILISIIKGWNHFDTIAGELEVKEGIIGFKKDRDVSQKEIIERLLKHPDLDINVIHLINGMTPLHFACLRGDDPELIIHLLKKGADPEAKDYSGKTPSDCLEESFESAKKIIVELSGNDLNELNFSKTRDRVAENELYTATLPTRENRNQNIKIIKGTLAEVINSAASSQEEKKFSDLSGPG